MQLLRTSFSLALLAIGFRVPLSSAARSFSASSYEWSKEISSESSITLYWTHDPVAKTMDVALTAPMPSGGWLGLGFSKNSGMGHGDFVIGYITDSGPVVQDFYNAKEWGARPTLDAIQDLQNTGMESIAGGTLTVLMFRRDMVNCDAEDMDISPGTSRVLWAYGDSSPGAPGGRPISELPQHSDWGAMSVMMQLDSGLNVEAGETLPTETAGGKPVLSKEFRLGGEGATPFVIPAFPAGGWAVEYYEPNTDLTDVHLTQGNIDRDNVHYVFYHDQPNALDKHYDAIVGLGGGTTDGCSWDEEKFCLPASGKGTLYWWKGFDFEELTTKHHIIAYEPKLNPQNLKRTHHLLLYECTQKVVYDGIGYAPSAPKEALDCNFNEPVAIWAIGGGSFSFPAEAGYPIGPGFGRYFMLEFHYDSPEGLPPVSDDSGLVLYYTEDLRDHDVGVLYTGSLLSDFIVIPPAQEKFSLFGYCPGVCTEELPPEGINIFSVLLHSHLAGIGLRLQHQDAQGSMKPSPAYDDAYDFHLQEAGAVNPYKKMYPGDALKLECWYNTMSRDKPTLGGFGTYDEMCLAYIYYFPRQPLTGCLSGKISEDVHYATCFTGDGNFILNGQIKVPDFAPFLDHLNPSCPADKEEIKNLMDQWAVLHGGAERVSTGAALLTTLAILGFAAAMSF